MRGEIVSYLDEVLKLRVVCHLVVDSVRRNRVVGNVLHVRLTEVENGIIDGGGDGANDWVLLTLDLVEGVEHLPVVHVKLVEVVENVMNELGKTLPRDDGWVHLSKRLHIHLEMNVNHVT